MKLKIKLTTGKKLTLTSEEFSELLGYKQKPFFCMVFHYWFMGSKHFETHYVHAENEKEARKHALLIKEQTESTFNQCAFEIIEMYGEKDDI